MFVEEEEEEEEEEATNSNSRVHACVCVCAIFVLEYSRHCFWQNCKFQYDDELNYYFSSSSISGSCSRFAFVFPYVSFVYCSHIMFGSAFFFFSFVVFVVVVVVAIILEELISTITSHTHKGNDIYIYIPIRS